MNAKNYHPAVENDLVIIDTIMSGDDADFRPNELISIDINPFKLFLNWLADALATIN